MSHLTFTAALDLAEAQARSSLDAVLAERLSCAVSLVKDGRVFQSNTGRWEVDSTSREGLVYSINGNGCSCADARYRAPKGYCKHRLAAHLAARAQQLLAQPPAPVVPPGEPWPDNDVEVWPVVAPESPAVPQTPTAVAAPLPEAPVSITLKGLLHGQDVMVTLRGVDFASVKAQVEEAAQWLQAQTPPPPPQAPLSPQQHNAAAMHRRVTDFCPVHNVQMKQNHKDGRTWFSHRRDDGSWCKGR